MVDTLRPKFSLGKIVATPAALKAIRRSRQAASDLIRRHHDGDWGEALDAEDKALNDKALKDGSRIMSAFNLRSGQKIWIITEATGEDGQRAATTLLLPDEY